MRDGQSNIRSIPFRFIARHSAILLSHRSTSYAGSSPSAIRCAPQATLAHRLRRFAASASYAGSPPSAVRCAPQRRSICVGPLATATRFARYRGTPTPLGGFAAPLLAGLKSVRAVVEKTVAFRRPPARWPARRGLRGGLRPLASLPPLARRVPMRSGGRRSAPSHSRQSRVLGSRPPPDSDVEPKILLLAPPAAFPPRTPLFWQTPR